MYVLCMCLFVIIEGTGTYAPIWHHLCHLLVTGLYHCPLSN